MLKKMLHLILIFSIWTLTGCQNQQEQEAYPPEREKTFDTYITAEEYLLLHPEQKPVNSSFHEIVRQPAQPVDTSLKKEKVTIAIVYPGDQVSDYWRRSLKSFTARMDELGINYEVEDFFSKSGGTETRKQELQLKEALEHDPDYLVFTLDVNQHLRIIERILAQKRPKLILQNITTPLVIWEGNQPFYVGFDHAIGSRLIAEYYLHHANLRDPYGLLYYSEGYISKMRGDTFLKYMRDGEGPPMAASYYTDGNREKARQATLRLVKEADLQFIYACSTDVAFGAVDGLKELGLQGKIKVNGWGGGSQELAAVLNGELDVTVMRMNDQNGIAMAEAVRLGLQGLEDQIPTVFSGEFILVTKDTPQSEIDLLKERAFLYSGVPGN